MSYEINTMLEVTSIKMICIHCSRSICSVWNPGVQDHTVQCVPDTGIRKRVDRIKKMMINALILDVSASVIGE